MEIVFSSSFSPYIPLFRRAMNNLDVMQGTWNLVSATEDGKALPEDHVKQTTIVVKGNTFRFPGLAEDATAREGPFKLDATKNPKEMGSTSTAGEVSLGIWNKTATRFASLRPANHVQPSSIPSPTVAKSSKSCSGKRIAKQKGRRSPFSLGLGACRRSGRFIF